VTVTSKYKLSIQEKPPFRKQPEECGQDFLKVRYQQCISWCVKSKPFLNR
jgi:hypothetical protein